jgi:hypothetical protein
MPTPLKPVKPKKSSLLGAAKPEEGVNVMGQVVLLSKLSKNSNPAASIVDKLNKYSAATPAMC